MGIVVRNDFSCGWPIWWLEGLMAEPEELGLSAGLEASIRAWAREFNAQFDHLDGWKSPGARAAHVNAAARIESGLSAEVGDELEVHVDLWELGPA